MKEIIALIDADGLLYHSSKETLEDSLRIIDEKINNILLKTGCTYYILFLSPKRTFRHSIYPDYKANRSKHKSMLLWLSTLRSYLIEKYNAYQGINVEADDLVAYFYNNPLYVTGHKMLDGLYFKHNCLMGIEYRELQSVICSPDKDLISGFPGKHFNYTYYLEEKGNVDTLVEGFWEEVWDKDAKKFMFYQMVVGDSSDNIKGIEGKGIKFWEKIEEEADLQYILNLYVERYGESHGIYEFQKNYRLLYLLRTDVDFLREVGYNINLDDIYINEYVAF